MAGPAGTVAVVRSVVVEAAAASWGIMAAEALQDGLAVAGLVLVHLRVLVDASLSHH